MNHWLITLHKNVLINEKHVWEVQTFNEQLSKKVLSIQEFRQQIRGTPSVFADNADTGGGTKILDNRLA